MEEAIKSFLDSTDSEFKLLRQTTDLRGLINNNETAGPVNNTSLTTAVKQIIDKLQRYLNEQSFAGEFHPTGSTFIESDIPRNLDYDFLFVHCGIQDFELTPLDQEQFPDLYRGDSSLDARSLYEQFKGHIESAVKQINFQGRDLTLAGYGKPDYNGLRHNGPAVTCLIQHQAADSGDKVITIDLTLGLPAPDAIQADIIHRLESSPIWGSQVQHFPEKEKAIHIVPTYKPNEQYLWLLSTAVLETKILPKLKITKTIRAIKVLSSLLSLKSSEESYSEQIGFTERTTNIHKKLSGRLLKKPEERVTLGQSLFDDHVFLPEYTEKHYFEKTKEILSVSGAAVKFFVLGELRDGNCTPGDDISWTTVHRFFSTLVPEIKTALVNITAEYVLEQETLLNELHVEHPFLSSRVRKLNFAHYAVVNEDLVCSFGYAFQDRCIILTSKLKKLL